MKETKLKLNNSELTELIFMLQLVVNKNHRDKQNDKMTVSIIQFLRLKLLKKALKTQDKYTMTLKEYEAIALSKGLNWVSDSTSAYQNTIIYKINSIQIL